MVVSILCFIVALSLCFKRLFSCSMLTVLDVVKKRPPQRVQKRRNDVYVNRKTDFAAQLERCQKSLDSRFASFSNEI